MGSSSSRLGSDPSRTRVNRRSRLFSSLLCVGRSSSHTTPEMEDYPDQSMVNSAEHCGPVNSAEEASVVSRIITASSLDSGRSSGNGITTSEGTFAKHGFRNPETSCHGKCLSDSKELVASDQVSSSNSHDNSDRNRSSAEASNSFKEHQSSDPVSINVSANKDAVNGVDNSENKGVSQVMHPSSSTPPGLGESLSNRLFAENHMSEVTAMPNSNSDSVNHRSDVPVTSHSQHDESIQDAIPSNLGFLEPNREQDRADGNVIHVDVVSISSSILSSSNSDTRSHEARRNSRRLFWDAFSRRSSRRHVDSPTIVFSTDNTDDLASHERWLLDFGGDFFDDGIGSDSGYLGSRIHRRSEIWERLRNGLDDNGGRSISCPSGLHPDGSCSCGSFLMSEESNTRASISRIVMLAEALFEVLDEIHRQPVSLSLSMMSLPAPEAVVDSFPLKNHKKVDKVEGNDDNEQCYICLAEYEEGDKIRVLPCHHEYHMSCVDKWLKEIHGVCPLCRGDVRQGASEPSAQNSEVLSI